jgi:hypothetical protein
MELPGSPTETRMRTAAGKTQGKAQGKARQDIARQGKARQGYNNRELTSAPARRGWLKILNVFCFVKAQSHNSVLQRETRKTL